jgi:methylglutaconyl-CoA hydratase
VSEPLPSPLVLSAIDGRGIATVTLNRPERHNAYDGPLIDQLIAAIAAFAAEPRVRVVLVRGAGRHFQAGADVEWLRRMGEASLEDNLAFSLRTTEAMRALCAFPQPTIALVHGACMGGGVGLVAACDVAIATEGASFALSEVRRGIIPAPIIPQLCAAMGVRELRRYGITGERFDAREARRIGLVHEVCPDGGLDAAAAPIVEAILAGGPQAIAQSKALVLARGGLAISDGEVRSLAAQAALRRASPEAAEGLSSFLEKRDPSWYPPKGEGN